MPRCAGCCWGFVADQLWLLLFAVAACRHLRRNTPQPFLFVQRSFGPGQQGQGQALYAALAGVGGAGALYAGYSWNSLGPAWTFALASVAAVAAAAIMAACLRDHCCAFRITGEPIMSRLSVYHESLPAVPNKVLSLPEHIQRDPGRAGRAVCPVAASPAAGRR